MLTNAVVHYITSLNSKNFHINVLGCKNITFHHVNIMAPDESPNTIDIHLGRSNGIVITNSIISTGNDCISIVDDTKNLNITKVVCGPGHGISLRSLGKYNNEEPVKGISVVNCTLRNTMNGVRIKTWPSTLIKLNVSKLHFENIMMENISSPIFIDQQYCPHNFCKLQVHTTIHNLFDLN